MSTFFDLSWTLLDVSFTARIDAWISQGQMQLQLNCACFWFENTTLGRTQIFSFELFCSIKGDTCVGISDNSEPYIELQQFAKFENKNMLSEMCADFCLCSLFWLVLQILYTMVCTHKFQSNDLNPLFLLSLEGWGSRIGDGIECFVVVCYFEMPVACELYYMGFSVVEVGLTFNRDGSDRSCTHHMPAGWLEICSLWRCHLSQSCPNSLLWFFTFHVRLVRIRQGPYKSSFLGPSGIWLLPAAAGQRLTGLVLAGLM